MNDQILCINKPLGWTSFDVVKKIKGLTKAKKVGHAGTLDPLATGVLILGLGKETKNLQTYQNLPKTYEAEIVLGGTTQTDDLEFLPENLKPTKDLDKENIKTVIQDNFVGRLEQLPPQFSARKVNGKRAYKLARSGQKVELKPSQIEVYGFEVLNLEISQGKVFLAKFADLPKTHQNHEFVIIKARINCSKGTYIRSLARDLGVKLGTGGFLKSLVRTQIGDFKIEDSKTIAEIQKMLYKQPT
jgi:tRNA pseudouridine55 synthase